MPIFEKSIILERQRKAAQALEKAGVVVLVGAGEPVVKPGGLDQTYPFLPHPDYYWLSGSRRSGGIMAYEPGKGWVHFVRQADEVECLWEGVPEVPEGEDVKKIQDWLKTLRGMPVAALGNIETAVVNLLPKDFVLNERIGDILSGVRRLKDEAELALIRKAVDAAAGGFAKAREFIRPGVTERRIQIEMEAEMFRLGADSTAFGSIVGTGRHAAVLHFEPTNRIVEPDDAVLIDAGAEIFDYCADVTRVYPAGKSFAPGQKDIYDIVLKAQLEAIKKCRPGTEWYDVHIAAAGVIALGLRDLGILKGSVDGLLESGAVSMFFPHGVGHMTGLRVRDAGGKAPGRKECRICCGARLRVDLPLERGLLMTVEPGIYFVQALLDNAERRAKYKDAVNWRALENPRWSGGVRIEDDILITAGDPEVLTSAIPK